MTFTVRRMGTCLALLLALTACQRGPQAVMADKTVDETAIRHLLDEIARTFNAGDYDGMFAQYRDDVVVSAPGAPDVVGKVAWRAGLSALPKGVTLKMRFDTQELQIEGDMAYERGTYVIEAQDAVTRAFVPVVAGRHTHIFRRDTAGSWKGWRLMENSADPAASPLPVPSAPQPA